MLQQRISRTGFGQQNGQQVDKFTYQMPIEMTPTRAYDKWPGYDVLFDSYRAFRGILSPPKGTLNPQAWRQNARRLYVNTMVDLSVTHLFLTSKGIVGLSRDDILPGDWVFFFGGVRGAWILRDTGEGYYRIVSICPNNFSRMDVPVEVICIY
jgi:hypothetical protein